MTQNNINFFYFFLILSIFLFGFIVHGDYGVTWDEFKNRNYAYEVTKTGTKAQYNKVLGQDGLNHAATRGPLFLICLNFAEKLFAPNDLHDQFKLRHLFNHLLFIFAGFCFLILLKNIFQDDKIVTISILMFFLSPRIYAHSFYNPVDIPFLCFIVFFLFTFFHIFNGPKFYLFVIHAIICGVATSLRTVGEITILVTIGATMLSLTRNRKDKELIKKDFISLGLFCFISLLVYYIATPYLWSSPLKNFFEIHRESSNFGVGQPTLFLGNVYYSLNVPWYYILTWIIISLPSMYVLMLVFSYIKSLMTFKHQFLKNNSYQAWLFLILSAVLISASLFKYSKYNDWRHFYFLYPIMILLIAFTINSLKNNVVRKIIFSLFVLQFLVTSYDMHRYHPHQIVFFNRLYGGIKKAKGQFPLDYFGSSFKQALNQVLKIHQESQIQTYPIRVSFLPEFPGRDNLLSLPKKTRENFKLESDFNKSDYIATNLTYAPDEPKHEKSDELILYEIKIDEVPIHRLFIGRGNWK